MLTVDQVIFGFGFTRRELEVGKCMAEGMSCGQIATALTISRWTVRRHEQKIRTKLDAGGRTRIVVRLRELGVHQVSIPK